MTTPPGFLPWRGVFVRVDADREWRWVRCVVCGQPLSDEASQAAGIGPECARRVVGDRRARLLDSARRQDRDRYVEALAEARRAEARRRHR